ncbi:Anhydro-N-acetylmuramic acid kinase [Streptomyces antimycoticus]
MRVIGLMSGTSFDAIEAAAADLTLDGDNLLLHPLGHLSVPYTPDLRELIAAALPPAATTIQAVCALDTEIGQAFADAAVLALHELCDSEADLVACHGQPCTTGSRTARSAARCSSVSPPGSPRRPACRSSPICAAGTSPPVARAHRWSP